MLNYMSLKEIFSRLINNIYLFPIACFLGSWLCWGEPWGMVLFLSEDCMLGVYWSYIIDLN